MALQTAEKVIEKVKKTENCAEIAQHIGKKVCAHPGVVITRNGDPLEERRGVRCEAGMRQPVGPAPEADEGPHAGDEGLGRSPPDAAVVRNDERVIRKPQIRKIGREALVVHEEQRVRVPVALHDGAEQSVRLHRRRRIGESVVPPGSPGYARCETRPRNSSSAVSTP